MARRKKKLAPIDEEVQRLLAEQVEKSGLTQDFIGREIDMSQNRVGIILRRETPPASLGEIDAIAQIAGIKLSDIISRAESNLSNSTTTPSK